MFYHTNLQSLPRIFIEPDFVAPIELTDDVNYKIHKDFLNHKIHEIVLNQFKNASEFLAQSYSTQEVDLIGQKIDY